MVENVLLAVADYQAEEHRLDMKIKGQKLHGLGLIKDLSELQSKQLPT